MDFQSNVAMTAIKMLKPPSFSCHVHGPEIRTWKVDATFAGNLLAATLAFELGIYAYLQLPTSR